MIRRVPLMVALVWLMPTLPAHAQIVADGGLEEGTPNPFWDEFSKSFDSPICSGASCTDFFGGAFEGLWWAWFGGSAAMEVGSLSQEVTIPSGTATLSFQLDITAASGNGVDFVTVSIDDEELFTALESDVGKYHPWTEITVDVSTFADGGTHLLSIDSTTVGFSNFFIDAVAITVEAAGLSGDCDGDNDVDLVDFASFQLCFTGPGGVATPECACADIDDDGDVDLVDFAEFQLAFTGPL